MVKKRYNSKKLLKTISELRLLSNRFRLIGPKSSVLRLAYGVSFLLCDIFGYIFEPKYKELRTLDEDHIADLILTFHEYIEDMKLRKRPAEQIAASIEEIADEFQRLTGLQNDEQLSTSKKPGNNMEVPWSDEDPNYMQNSKAVVAFTNGKMLLTKFTKELKKTNNKIHYMRKGHRCKVHIGDFREYANKHYPSDDIAAELTDELMADLEARKQQERKKKDNN